MNQKTNDSQLREMLISGMMNFITVAVALIMIMHGVFLYLVWNAKLNIMIGMEVFNLFYYFHVFLVSLLKKNRGRGIFVKILAVTILETDLYMIVSALLMGYECRFVHYMYPLLVISALGYYMDHNLKKDLILKFSIVFSYFVIRLYEMNANPYYGEVTVDLRKFFSFVNPTASIIFVLAFVILVPILMLRFEKTLVTKATVDELTGLLNRNSLGDIPFEHQKYNLAILDIDDFKKINDKYGHHNGDLVLKHLGTILKSLEVQYHFKVTAFRWGGEEFLVAFLNETGYKYVFIDIMESLRKSVESSEVYLTDTDSIRYSITVGTAFPDEASSYEELLKLADARLYEGKQSGKNRVVSGVQNPAELMRLEEEQRAHLEKMKEQEAEPESAGQTE